MSTGQTRLHSFAEQIANQVVGFGISFGVNLIILPALGMPGGAGKALLMTIVFTVLSIVRGYFLRRAFNWLHLRQGKTAKPDLLYDNLQAATCSLLQHTLERMRPLLCAAAQQVYDEWEQEDGVDVELGTGGICDKISEAMSDVLAGAGFDTQEGGQEGDDHSYVIAGKYGFEFMVDIPSHIYEIGGGYKWTKLPDVQFKPHHIFMSRLDTD